MSQAPEVKETKAQRAERLKLEKNPWEAFNDVREFARAGRSSVVPEWTNLYFKWWGVYTQGDGVGEKYRGKGEQNHPGGSRRREHKDKLLFVLSRAGHRPPLYHLGLSENPHILLPDSFHLGCRPSQSRRPLWTRNVAQWKLGFDDGKSIKRRVDLGGNGRHQSCFARAGPVRR